MLAIAHAQLVNKITTSEIWEIIQPLVYGEIVYAEYKVSNKPELVISCNSLTDTTILSFVYSTAFEPKEGHSLLVIQCDSGHLNGDLIACARYRVSDVRGKSLQQQTHVLFIVHLPRKIPSSSFVGFQGDPWICAHVEDLHPGDDDLSLDAALKLSISELFYSQEFILGENTVRNPSYSSPSKTSTSKHLCQRLHGCIHAAASRIYDSEMDRQRTTKRVELLKELIPEELEFPLDLTKFYGILIMHMLQVLRQQDSERTDDKEWVLVEALNPKHLQCGGAFMNVLTRKIDEILSPLFAEIIALIDFNYNLNVLLPKHVPLYTFWVSMFRDVYHFEYKDIGASPREQVPGVGGHLSENMFKCQLPFSWIIKERVEAEWRYVPSAVGDGDDRLHDELYRALSEKPIGEVMNLVDRDCIDDFAERYLHDFVRSMHKCKHKNPGVADLEYKMICEAVKGSAVFCHQHSLLSMIVTFHICYDKMKDQIFWFGELGAYIPGILPKLTRKADCSPGLEVVLHLRAANAALQSNELDISRPLRNGVKELRSWLQKVYKSQAAIDAILSMSSQHSLAQSARKRWSILHAMQKFVEHVLLREKRLIVFARRLDTSLQKDSDLMKATTYEKLQKLLSTLDNTLVKLRLGGPKQRSIRESCAYFLMEVLSSHCLGGDSMPEDCVIDSLIEMTFPMMEGGAKPAAGKLTFIHDAVPGFHLFVLRLLLQCKMDQTRRHLESYMQKYAQHCTKKKISKTEMFLQFVDCYEDCLSRRFSACSHASQITKVTELLSDGYDTCASQTPTEADGVTIDYLIGIGKIRFSLVFASDLLSGLTPERIDTATEKFLEKVKNVTCDTRLTLSEGSAQVFLLRNLVRWNGYTSLMNLALSENLPLRSIVPASFIVEDDKLFDPFVIYNPQYAKLRDCVADAVCFENFDDLTAATESLKVEDAVPLLLVLYEKLTLAGASERSSTQWTQEVQMPFMKFIRESQPFVQGRHLSSMAESLVNNSLGTPLKVEAEQDPLHRILTVIVLHFTSVIYCKQKHEILRLFYGLMEDPKSMRESHIPTMPEKTFGSAQFEFGVKFYECPKGHKFHANPEPMKPVPARVRQKSEAIMISCYECGSRVDVNQYVGRELVLSSRKGYMLGSPTNRSGTPDPVRELSAASSVIIRILMHSALLWASSSYEELYVPVAQFMNLNHKKCIVTAVCLEHLKCDLRLLSKVIGRSIDEAALTVQIILQEILQKPPPPGVTEEVGRLSTPEARAKWEDTFDAEYIQPTLENLAVKLHRAIMGNDKKEHNELFAAVYGKTTQSIEEGDLPKLWMYRPRMTLDHLPQLLPYKEISAKHPMLHIFLRMEPSLRATKHIPQLQQLQQCLYDQFHHRVDAKQAAALTLAVFLDRMSHENRKTYKEMFSSLIEAWKLVREKLPDYARSYLLMEEEYLVPAIDDDTPLEYLIPTAEGRGACTTALVKYLVLIHNHFIQSCRKIAEKQPESKTQWMERFIPLSRVQHCHLLDYEQELVPLVVSHCHYSGATTHGQINCNLPALEKHILDKFIHGKPVISLEIPQVAYRKKRGVSTATTLVAVRKNVPQKELPLHVQLGILKELNEVHHLSQTLEGVNIMMGFLASGGGKPGLRVQEYRRKTLKMEHHPFSQKAEEHCNLEHIVCLWRTLSVGLAKHHTLTDQEPFEHIPEKFQENFAPENTFHGALDDKVECAPEKRFRKALANLDEDQLVEALYEFIETSVKHTRSADSGNSLVEALQGYITQNNLLPIQRLKEEFEGFDINLGQAVALWKYIVRPPEYEDTNDKD